AVGLAIGALAAVVPACGTKPPPARCGKGTCDRCCDGAGTCFTGTTAEQCGLRGVTCQACSDNQVCSADGQCRLGGTAAGGGGGAGGGTGGGSGITGGGAGGGTNGDGGCSASTCAGGCCNNGQCIMPAQQTFARCGTGGVACAGCPVGKSCMAGSCGAPACN